MSNQEHPNTLSDWLRGLTGNTMNRIGLALHKLGLHPDLITFMGLLVVVFACLFVMDGQMQLGALILVLGLPLDALDGAVARAMKRTGRFGAVLDSTLDRYADGFIFAALSYYFAVQDRFEWMLLALVALVGSFLVSYVRARAEGVDVVVKVGLFTRLERVGVILLMLFIPPLLELGVLVLAIGTNFTALHRLWYVYRTLKEREA